jgi:methylmalonyl-CoA carboxyltransferase 5S subunit
VTPSSQIVGTQAVFNVLMGRYKVMTAEFADLMLGYYGRCLGERNPEVIEGAEKQTHKPPITQRPADLLTPEWDELRAQAQAVPGCDGSDEDVLTHAMFPKVADGFFATRPDGPKNVGRDPKEVAAEKAAASNGSGSGSVRTPITYKVTVNGTQHSVSVAPA